MQKKLKKKGMPIIEPGWLIRDELEIVFPVESGIKFNNDPSKLLEKVYKVF